MDSPIGSCTYFVTVKFQVTSDSLVLQLTDSSLAMAEPVQDDNMESFSFEHTERSALNSLSEQPALPPPPPPPLSLRAARSPATHRETFSLFIQDRFMKLFRTFTRART